jgi:hypothetical protein
LDWGADLEKQSFEYKMKGDPEDQPGEIITIERYFLLKYKMKLRYPKMPIVFLSDRKEKGWFPIEFLFQAWGQGTRYRSQSGCAQVQRSFCVYKSNRTP